jgi:cytochrome P450
VRISPEAVCVADAEAFQTIHKIGSGFLKSPWYRQFRSPDPSGSVDVFSSLDPRMHGAKRKLLARPFSNTSLRQHWEGMVIDKVKVTVRQIWEESRSQGHANIFKWWSLMTTDMIGNVAFGEDFGMSETGVVSFTASLDIPRVYVHASG